MRRYLWLALCLVLALNTLITTAPALGAENVAVAPHVIDTSPFRGEELPLGATVTFYFDQPMDGASVDAALTITPDVVGQLEWPDDATAVFHPATPWERDHEYVLTIGDKARSRAGTPLQQPFSLPLKTI